MKQLIADIVKPAELSRADRDAWIEMLRAKPAWRSPFFHPSFVETVDQVRHDVEVAVFRRSGARAPVAFLPYQRCWGGFARPPGAPFSDLQGLIKSDELEFTTAEAVQLAGLSAYRYTALLGDADQGDDDACAVVELGAERTSDMSARASRHAKKLRQRRRRAERERGEVELILDDRDKKRFEALIALKRRQFRETGLHDVLRPFWARRMMRRLRTSSRDEVYGRLSTLLIGGEPAAHEFNLCLGDVIHGWIVAYRSDYSAFSPGHLMIDGVLQEATADGFEEYCLGVGAHEYLDYYSTHSFPVSAGLLCADTVAGRAQHLRWQALSAIEQLPARSVSRFAGAARRRAEQIAAAEPYLHHRIGGAFNAVTSRLTFRRA